MKPMIRPGDVVKFTPRAARYEHRREPFVITEIQDGEYASEFGAWFSPSDLIFIRRATDKEYLAALERADDPEL